MYAPSSLRYLLGILAICCLFAPLVTIKFERRWYRRWSALVMLGGVAILVLLGVTANLHARGAGEARAFVTPWRYGEVFGASFRGMAFDREGASDEDGSLGLSEPATCQDPSWLEEPGREWTQVGEAAGLFGNAPIYARDPSSSYVGTLAIRWDDGCVTTVHAKFI